jgi:hypothetical protein
MSKTVIGNSLNSLPAKGIGQPHSPQKPGSQSALPVVIVPPPSSLVINGKVLPLIDLSKTNSLDIINLINIANIPGVKATLDNQGTLQISGIDTIDGNSNLLAILGIGNIR